VVHIDIFNIIKIIFLKFLQKKTFLKRFYLPKPNNDFNITFFKNLSAKSFVSNYISTVFLKNIIPLLVSVFCTNGNVIFVDYDNNYNYLPISNSIIFDKSSIDLCKYIKYFNVKLFLFINLGKKNYLLKRLINFNLLNISLNCDTSYTDMELFIKNKNSEIVNYTVYIILINIYIQIKKKYYN
jgi:hypothetical protein